MNGGRSEIQSERKECAAQEQKKTEIEKFCAKNALTATISSAHKWRSVHNRNFFRNFNFPSFTWNVFFLQYRHILMIESKTMSLNKISILKNLLAL